MVTLGKVMVIIQGDRYIYRSTLQKNNIRQLKILGSCSVTIIYRVNAISRAAIHWSTLQKI